MAPAHLLCLREQRPDLFERVAMVLTLADWALHWLTGERVGERALAGESGLIDITSASRDSEMWRLAQVYVLALGLGQVTPLPERVVEVEKKIFRMSRGRLP
jgi:sugar (pentulose or hexulose) kinase